MFAITNASEFLGKVIEDLSALEEKIDDPGCAMNCILSSYHLHEGVWAHAIKPTVRTTLGSVIINDKLSFAGSLETNCPHFTLLQELTNGTKHCAPVHSTRKVARYGRGPFGIGPFGASYLVIDLGEEVPVPQRWLVASDMLHAVVNLWNEFFVQHKLGRATNPAAAFDGEVGRTATRYLA